MIQDRVIEYLEKKGISKYRFYKDTGLSNGFLDKKGNIGVDKCEKIIYVYPDINLNWLITGHGPMFKEDAKAGQTNPGQPVAKRATEKGEGIPLIPADAMAGVCQGELSVLDFECERYVVPAFKGADFLITVKGSSMYPKYNSGDIVACKKLPLNDLFFQWNKVYVIDTIQGALIKRVKKANNDDHIILASDNPSYEPFELHKSQINAVAIVMGVIRLE